MNKYFYLEHIEDGVYQRLPDDLKTALNKPDIIKEIKDICFNRAKKILEEEDVSKCLNFQLFENAIE